MSKTGNQHVNKLKIEDTDLHVVPVPGTYEFKDGINYLTIPIGMNCGYT